MRIDSRSLARALGGEVCSNQIRAPGPGHSAKDRSPVRLTPDGFVVYSHAGDDWQLCRDYVRGRLCLPAFGRSERRRPQPVKREPRQREQSSVGYALRLWGEARNLHGTLSEKYLTGRGLLCSEDFSHVLRFHPDCVFKEIGRFRALVSLIRNIHSDGPQGIQLTALAPDGNAIKHGGKTLRRTHGAAKYGAIKLDRDEDVTMGLCVGEGLESTLTGRQSYAPAWALLNADGIANLPVLAGVEGLTIFTENDERNQNHHAVNECWQAWHDAGRNVCTLDPLSGHNDLNDELRGAR